METSLDHSDEIHNVFIKTAEAKTMRDVFLIKENKASVEINLACFRFRSSLKRKCL